LDSELGEEHYNELREHLAKCAACRAKEAALRRALDLLQEWPETEPRLCYDALLARLDQRQVAREGSVLVPKLPVPRWATAVMVTTSIALGFALGIIIPEGNTPTSSPSEQQVASAMDLYPYDMIEASLTYSITNSELNPTREKERR
jgi:anti-sigma factor RsiW